MSYTPGPWEACHTVGAGWRVRRQHERPGYEGLAPICSMAWWQFDIPGIIDEQISEANARLISASPELLEVLQSLADDVERGPDCGGGFPSLDRARAAIAKATGQPQVIEGTVVSQEGGE